MSEHPILPDVEAIDVVCPHCGAVPGQRCRTRAGKLTAWPHTARQGESARVWLAEQDAAEASR